MTCWRGVCHLCRRGRSGSQDGPEDRTLHVPRLPDRASSGSILECGRSSDRSRDNVHDAQLIEPAVLKKTHRRINSVAAARPDENQRDLRRKPALRGGDPKISDHYMVGDSAIGQGSFSIVRMASCNKTGLNRAVKVITKDVKDAPDFRNEIELLLAMDHENIIKLFETFEDPRKYYLVMELCTGGELFERVVEQGTLTEPQAALLMRQIGRTVCYMHKEGVVHRDLKPENFVFASKGPIESTPLKLIDFGLSRRFASDEVLTTAVGTVLYVAPEVFSQTYGPSCDLWSFGVILYVLLCGYPPFDGRTAKQVAKSVKKGVFSLQGDYWDAVSDSGKDLIRALLTKDVAARLTEMQVLEHEWISSLAAGSSGAALGPELMEHLQDLGLQNQKAKSLQRKRATSL